MTLTTIIIILILSSIIYHQARIKPQEDLVCYYPTYLIIPTSHKQSTVKWLNDSSPLFLEKLLQSSKAVILKNYKDKPNNLSQKQYLEAQWKLAPNLKVITTDVSLKNNTFSVNISLIDKQQNITNEQFNNKKLQTAYLSASNWLSNQNLNGSTTDSFSSIMPHNSHVLELYLRGLSAISNNKQDKAKKYFELCLEEVENHFPSLLELAKLYDEDGDSQRALSLLDLVEFSNGGSNIEVQVGLLRGKILYKQGFVEISEKIFTDLLNKYKGHQGLNMLNVKISLSGVYRYQSKNNEVIRLLNEVESQLLPTSNIEILAEVYKQKSSMLLKMGKVKEAKVYINNALRLNKQLGNLYGIASNLAISSRIESYQAHYELAAEYLNQTLDIMKEINNKRGIAASLNEIIALSITQGKLNYAWNLNQDFERIAIDIGFTSMLLASKLFTIEMSLIKKQWKTAEIYLKEHKELANTRKNQYGIIHNKLHTITLYIERGYLQEIPT